MLKFRDLWSLSIAALQERCCVPDKKSETNNQRAALTLNNGDKATVIGEKGNGKSALLKWLCDPASIDSYTEWSGEVIGLPERLSAYRTTENTSEVCDTVYLLDRYGLHIVEKTFT